MMNPIPIADLRFCSSYPVNSVAAAVAALRLGYRELLVEPVFGRQGTTLDVFLGDYDLETRAALCRSELTGFFAQHRNLEFPEPLTGLLNLPQVGTLWCVFRGPHEMTHQAAASLAELGERFAGARLGLVVGANSDLESFPGITVASPSWKSEYYLATLPSPRLALRRNRERGISLMPWSLGLGRHLQGGVV